MVVVGVSTPWKSSQTPGCPPPSSPADRTGCHTSASTPLLPMAVRRNNTKPAGKGLLEGHCLSPGAEAGRGSQEAVPGPSASLGLRVLGAMWMALSSTSQSIHTCGPVAFRPLEVPATRQPLSPAAPARGQASCVRAPAGLRRGSPCRPSSAVSCPRHREGGRSGSPSAEPAHARTWRRHGMVALPPRPPAVFHANRLQSPPKTSLLRRLAFQTVLLPDGVDKGASCPWRAARARPAQRPVPILSP